jgi:4-amino-4-deoxy-L-arabinose transferase-like glycosyltransferase
MAGFRDPIQRWEWVALIAILIVAITLRVWRLDSVPPGLTHDEASNGHDAAAVLRGVRPIYFTVGYGHEPLYPYSVALSMALLGPTSSTLRLTTVMWGSCLILLSYLLSRRLFGILPALIAAAWMAVSFWCVMTSRIGLRAVTSATTFAASAYAFWRALPLPGAAHKAPRLNPGSRWVGGSWLWWGLSGFFLGASIYTYMASRAMPAVYVLFLAYLLVLHVFGRREECETALVSGKRGLDWGASLSSVWRRQLVGVAVLLLIASILAAPLMHYLRTHPEAERRLEQLSGPIENALDGRFSELWRRVSRSLPMFTIRGDPLWLYNIPGRPLLDVTGGAFFYAGLFVCLWRWRDPRYVFLLLWLVVGVAPALVTGPDATALRSIAAQPALFIIAAVGLSVAARFFHRRLGRWGRVATSGAVVALLMTTGIRTVHAYFNLWGQHRDVRVAYHHALVEQARYLDAEPENGTVALSSIYPGRFHDPYAMEIALRRDDLSLRWFDGRSALVFPAEGESRVVIPTIAPLDAALLPLFMPQASLVHTERFRSDDLITRFDVYRFGSKDALQDLLQTTTAHPVYWSPSKAFPTDDPRPAYQPLDLPVNVDDVIHLVGYDLRTPTIQADGEIELLTVWHVSETFTSEAVAFTHLIGHQGRVIAQIDRLDVPSWHWRPGDAFVQLHRFSVGTDVSPGLYSLEVGLYTREDLERLPVVVDGERIDDRILLRPLEVIRG